MLVLVCSAIVLRMVRIETTVLLGASLVGLAQAQTYTNVSSNSSLSGALYKDPSQPIETRVQDLVSRMTLDEKVAQLMQGKHEPIQNEDSELNHS